ncbi:MAG TPA: TRSP domain-containing protein, partial [Pseudonocardia sp.]
LADAGHDVAFSSTTRSPAVMVASPGYALTSGIAFPAHDDPADGPGPRFAYNVGRAQDPPWDHVLVVVDPPADTPALRTGLLPALAPHARRTSVVVTP